MEASNPKQASENLVENAEQCQLGFKDQCKIVWEGAKKGFSYDGCSAVPDFNFGADCCGEHDFHYQDKNISRAEADKRLRECIQKKGYIVLPWVYWAGVRLFGGMFWNKK
jgi:hypothetical protein